MAFILAQARDVDGNLIDVRYDGPREHPDDPKSRTPVGYLKPSGATYVNPLYAIGSRRDAHLGLDGHGNEGVSDQRWIYDIAEAAQLEKDEPERFVRASS